MFYTSNKLLYSYSCFYLNDHVGIYLDQFRLSKWVPVHLSEWEIGEECEERKETDFSLKPPKCFWVVASPVFVKMYIPREIHFFFNAKFLA